MILSYTIGAQLHFLTEHPEALSRMVSSGEVIVNESGIFDTATMRLVTPFRLLPLRAEAATTRRVPSAASCRHLLRSAVRRWSLSARDDEWVAVPNEWGAVPDEWIAVPDEWVAVPDEWVVVVR